MTAFTKADLVNSLVLGLQLNKQEAKILVDDFFELLRQKLFEGHSVRLSGFGNFMLRDKRARLGRNPKTKEEIAISARRVVTFRSGLKLKKTVHAFTNREK